MRDALRRALHLGAVNLGSVGAFFVLYLTIFAFLTLTDGVASSLFVHHVGAQALPKAYAAVAVLNLAAIALYVTSAERIDATRLLLVLLGSTGACFVALWAALQSAPGPLAFGSVFALREVTYTVMLMHFGTVLQDYFTREQLTRAMPVVYAGGRVGGLVGAAGLALLAPVVGVKDLLLAAGGLLVLAAALTVAIWRRLDRTRCDADEAPDAGVKGDASALDQRARGSFRDFLGFVWASPLMFWHTVTSILYVGARFILNYQYNTAFGEAFATDTELATFIGLCTAVGLVFTLVFQLFVVSRLVSFAGLKVATLLYALILVASAGLNGLGVDLPRAVLARFVEVELRFGLRNPVNQLVINKFSKLLRVRVRAWSMGALIPGSTIAVSGALGLIGGSSVMVGAAGVLLAGGYLGSCLMLNSTYTERPERRTGRGEEGGRTSTASSSSGNSPWPSRSPKTPSSRARSATVRG